MKMIKSVYLTEPNNIQIANIQSPKRKDNEVLIKVKSAGICGSDIGAYRGTNPLVTYPRIIGHEIVGEVLAGSDLPENIKIGDNVIVDPYIYCGQCYPCSINRTNCCQNLKVIGVHVDGGMQEVLTHPSHLIHKIPENIPIEYAPLAEPLTIALHALHRAKLKSGEHIVIIGAGAIGVMMALVAIHYGATPILIDIVEERLNYAKKLGVVHAIHAKNFNCVDEINRITHNRLAEVVVEASGANSSIRNTLDFVSFAGRIALTGWPKAETSLPTNLITFKEIDIVGSRTSVNEFKEALTLIANKVINPKDIISKVVFIDEVPDMVKELSEFPERYLKVHAIFS